MRQFINALASSGGEIQPPPPTTIDLYLNAGGQSNMMGQADGPPSNSNLASAITGAKIYDPDTGTYDTLEYNVNNWSWRPQQAKLGPLLSIAWNWVNNGNGDLSIEKPAEGATGINPSLAADESWHPTHQGTTDALIDRFRDAQTRIAARITSEAKTNPKYVFVWIQGEKDGGQTQADYYSWFVAMLANVEAIKAFDLVVICTVNTNSTQYGAGPKLAQLQWVSENSERAVSIDLDDFTLGPDSLHYEEDQYELIGAEIVSRIESFFNL